MDIWYAHLSEEELMAAIEHHGRCPDGQGAEEGREEAARRRAEKTAAKARTRDSLQALSKLAEHRRRPVPDRQPAADRRPGCASWRQLSACPPTSSSTRSTSSSAPTARRCRTIAATCSSGSRSIDVARKVVGVGSVGTRAFIVLLQGRDQEDPLFLQVKEATASVLEDHLPKSRYQQPGERVVQGQRMMQAASDIYLGWTKGVRGEPLPLLAPAARHEGLGRGRGDGADRLSTFYARICGRTLARAHARSGDPIAIAAYLGKNDAFDQSITDFSERYADQNERDYQAFTDADPVRTTGSDRRRLRSGRDPMGDEREHPEHGGVLSNLDMKVEGVLGTSATPVLKVGTRHVDGLLVVGRGSDGSWPRRRLPHHRHEAAHPGDLSRPISANVTRSGSSTKSFASAEAVGQQCPQSRARSPRPSCRYLPEAGR